MQAIAAEAEQRVLLPDLLILGARQSGMAVLGSYNDKPQSEARDMHGAAAPVELLRGANSATMWYCSGTGEPMYGTLGLLTRAINTVSRNC